MKLRWPRWQEKVAWPTSQQWQQTTACTTCPEPGRRPCCGAVLCTTGSRGHCGNAKEEELACIKSQATLRRTSNGQIRCLKAHRDREGVTDEVPKVWLRLAGRVFTR